MISSERKWVLSNCTSNYYWNERSPSVEIAFSYSHPWAYSVFRTNSLSDHLSDFSLDNSETFLLFMFLTRMVGRNVIKTRHVDIDSVAILLREHRPSTKCKLEYQRGIHANVVVVICHPSRNPSIARFFSLYSSLFVSLPLRIKTIFCWYCPSHKFHSLPPLQSPQHNNHDHDKPFCRIHLNTGSIGS